MSGGRRVVLYSSPGCHLCEDASALVRGLQGTRDFAFIEVDIHSDPELERRYLFEVPVIEVDGVVVTQAPVDIDRVREAVSG